MNAEIIAIGTEILLGEIIDTNSAHIAQSLPELGIDLLYKSVVGDNLGRIVETLQRAWGRSDLTVITGGLGPTEDDMTREGICELLAEEPHVDPDLERHRGGVPVRARVGEEVVERAVHERRLEEHGELHVVRAQLDGGGHRLGRDPLP